MDLSNRGPQPHSAAPNGQPANSFGPAANSHKSNKSSDDGRGMKIVQSIFMLSIVVVLIGLLVFLAFGNSNNAQAKSESKYIDSTNLQAVFLNTGQVYFGNLKSLNSSYGVLDNIYYLQTSSSSASSTTSSANASVSLVKLGCELHAPLDQMVINRTQITFWENLSPKGQVAKAVATFEKANPNGQKCSDQSASGSTGTPQTAPQASSPTTTKP
jgi:FlaG/FlaF family flagellin (archaellin)